MKITLAKTRKLLKELKKKYPDANISVDIIFSSWCEEHLTVYVESELNISSAIMYFNADEIRKEFGL